MSYLEYHQYGAGTLVKLSMSPVSLCMSCMNVFTCDNGLKGDAIHKNKFQCQFNMKIMRLYSRWYRHLINIRTYIHTGTYVKLFTYTDRFHKADSYMKQSIPFIVPDVIFVV